MDNIIDISFIIPCHNLELYIKPLLLSIQALNLDNIQSEFLFVLDNCTDKTEDIINNYMSDFNYQILKCNVHSCGLARNVALDQAQGTYIWFLDGDDWLVYPNVLQDVLPILNREKLNLMQVKFISNYFNREYFSMVWQYIYRRSFIGELRFLAIQPNEDVVFNKKLLDNGQDTIELPYYSIPTYFYNYNRPGSNMSQYRQNHEIS